jgi:hypothetical protein
MSVWSALLASLGAAGASLLTTGADVSDVLAQVSAGAGELTAGVAAAGVVLAAAAVYAPLPPQEHLGKPEAAAEARRRDHEAQEKELAAVRSTSRKQE